MSTGTLHAVILAGGTGTRFWPLSRALMPKQLLSIVSDCSMLALTLETKWGRLTSTTVLQRADKDGDGRLEKDEKRNLETGLADRLRRCLSFSNDQGKQKAACRVETEVAGKAVGPFGLFARATCKIAGKVRSRWTIESHCDVASPGNLQIELRPSASRHFEFLSSHPTGKEKGHLLILPQGTKSWSVTFSIVTGGATAGPKRTLAKKNPNSATGRLERMVAGPLSLGQALFALLVAFFLGAYHALSPGHGKTLTAAYLVGEDAGMGQAVALAGIVTVAAAPSVRAAADA